ncbi:phenylacetyl- ligase [Trichoderma arundinaceum]|uniref:Phenylacetyl-ligase n=1 Tax=Trichoderma arundinaceum TaxID=490622 RepID=A0A395NJT8_TRIAR|nr:phenylacetyl- ligase [Trichoderma arundinaceum]
MPIQSLSAPVEIPLVDIWSYYLEQPKEYPLDKPLFIDCDSGRSHSFNDIKHLALEFGRGLSHVFNWKRGDVMGLFTPNNIDIPSINFGIHWAGGIASPANPTYTPEELAHQLKDSGAKALLTQKPFLEAARKAAALANLPADRILLLGDGRDETGVHRHWSDITATGAKVPPQKAEIDPKRDLAYLVYSSGTTGLPKGVMLSHYNIVAQAAQLEKGDRSLAWDVDSQLGVLPFFHIYGLVVVIATTVATGVKCVVLPKFDVEKACKLIQDHHITFMYVPPPIVLALGKHPIVSKYDLSSLRWINSAAAPLSRELAVSVWDRLKVGVKQGYGLSETSPGVTMQLAEEWWKFQGSVGRLFSNMEAKIVDEDGKELGYDKSGELLLKGPNVFSGYWKRPELNKETFTDDGWYRTGDIFYCCPKGNFYITDRKKELIKYKGFQVPPAELESKLHGREDIADVCVVGVWDKEQHTEIPRAYIVLKPGVEETEARAKEITEWLNAKVAPPKKLRGGVRFIKEVPKSQAGKILRRVLRDQIKKEEEAEAAAPRAKL